MKNCNAYTAHIILKTDQHQQIENPIVVITYAMIEPLILLGCPIITSKDTTITYMAFRKAACETSW